MIDDTHKESQFTECRQPIRDKMIQRVMRANFWTKKQLYTVQLQVQISWIKGESLHSYKYAYIQYGEHTFENAQIPSTA